MENRELFSAYLDGIILEMTLEQAESASHQGD
jgi:Uma2 family endonuclease